MTPTTTSPEPTGRSLRLMLLVIIVVGGVLPPTVYWLALGRLPTVTPVRAQAMLHRPGTSALLVDVRPAEVYARRHIDGSRSWPLKQIRSVDNPADVPAEFKDRTLLLFCRVGVSSATATRHLTKLGVPDVFNVRGGELDWIGTAGGREGEAFTRWVSDSGAVQPFPFRPSTWYEQLALVASGFGFKATYTLLSLILVVILWRCRTLDLVALRWAMVCFFVGENACAVNYFVFSDWSYLLEYLHSFGMLLCFGFTAYAVVEGLDRRVFMVSDPGRQCAALNLCSGCVKYTDAPCGLRRTFYLLIAACIVLALAPLCSPWHAISYNTLVYGTPYHLTHPLVYQAFELRYCPLAAIVLMTASLLVLRFKRHNAMAWSKLFFAAGLGPFGFGYLRLILAGSYAENRVWFNFWEEATELLFIVGVCVLLWIFRARLLRAPAVAGDAES